MVQVGPPGTRRYEFLSVKERAVAEFVRRIRDKEWRFNTITWDKVSRLPLPRDVRSIRSAQIRITDGIERFGEGSNTQTMENTVDLMVEVAVPIGTDEEPSTVLNLVCAEVLDLFLGEHELFEEGAGEQLAISLYPREYVPDLETFATTGAATAMLSFEMRYRTRRRQPFLLPARPPINPQP